SRRVSAVSGVDRSTRRGAAASSAEYISASEGSSPVVDFAAAPVTGVSRATTEAAARRGEIALAISKGVVPAGTSRIAPSGRCTAIVWLLMIGWSPLGPRKEKTRPTH